MKKQRCGNCRFWIASVGQCRRYPPQTFHQVQRDAYNNEWVAPEWYWPITQEEEWCGEFKEGDEK